MAYASLTVEGGLFPPDLLDRVAEGELEAQRPQDFGADGRLTDVLQSSFSDARVYWETFQRRLARSHESLTTLTRDFWMRPLLELLGFDDLTFQGSARAADDSYVISHRAGQDENAPPVNIVALGEDLDRRGSARRSPHAAVQEYLNRSDALWGIVSNGEKLRLLRDSHRLSKPTYLEVDLRAMVEGNLYSEFVLLYRLLHRTRFPREAADAGTCPLERYYQQGVEEGGRVRDRLREGVEAALDELGNGFLAHRESEALRASLRAGRLKDEEYYRELLRLVYRLLFLMVAEERKLLYTPHEEAALEEPQRLAHLIYANYYSMGQLRRRAERPFTQDRHSDLWQTLCAAFRVFREQDKAARLGLGALNGELFGEFACRDLEDAQCGNTALLRAVRALSTFKDGDVRRRVNYAWLDVEELGSVYESLLEFRPQVAPASPTAAEDGPLRFQLLGGSERKTTGSYYTPPELVHELIESALVPVMEERLAAAKTKDDKIRALLDLRICDPASGSGHFLLAAARRVGRELAKVRSEEAEPGPSAHREAVRDVIRSCIYAVDKNPLAVDLCKVALWLEGHNAGLPLSFLDHHVRCGDSLVGVMDLEVLEKGIPDEAYQPVTGDDRSAAGGYKKRNKQERAGQYTQFATMDGGAEVHTFAADFEGLAAMAQRSVEDVRRAEDAYLRARTDRRWLHLKRACDLWAAAFFTPLRPLPPGRAEVVPTTGQLWQYLRQEGSVSAQMVGGAEGLGMDLRFFHWPLEFPEVFDRGGFDVVLGNPPWERIKLQEQEFFAGRDLAIANAQTKAERGWLIDELSETNPHLLEEFERAKHQAEAQSKFVRSSGRFKLSGRGDINTYAVFAEHIRRSLAPRRSRAGFIVQSDLVTSDTYKLLFEDLFNSGQIASFYDFVNIEGIFPGIHRTHPHFCLLTLTTDFAPHGTFSFWNTNTGHLRDSSRVITLTPEDLRLINPNTRTCPIFRSERDAEITRAIYRRVPVFLREGAEDGNPWDVSFLRLFDMSMDSQLFQIQEELEERGGRLRGNVFEVGQERWLPLYEAKMLHHFDHRWATYDGLETVDVTPEQKADPDFVVLPRYWVPQEEVDARLRGRWDRGWLLGWRDITNTTNERTVIASVLPRVGVGDKFLLMLPGKEPAEIAALLANLNSFVLDYCARQKLGGTSLKYFTMRQLPLLPPEALVGDVNWGREESLISWLASRVVELSHVNWEIAPFAGDLDYNGPPFRWDEDRRFLLRRELDAAFFQLYGLPREDVDYVMDTFPIVKRKDEQRWGEYRTKRVILEIYDEMQRAMEGGPSYQTRLDPPPADPRVAHRSQR